MRVSTKGGVLDMETVYANCNRDLFMVSMMLVNNETGALYPLKEVFAAAHAANPTCICHCDAVQGFLKTPATPRALGADLMTVSAHKIHGPKGVGALYIAPHLKKSKSVAPIFEGGGQEWGYRSGTENVIGIAGFAAAAEQGRATLAASLSHMAALSDRLIAGLVEGEIRVNLPTVRAPHIVNITLPHIKSETMLHFLSSKGIFVSSGSACSSHAGGPSAALKAFGLDDRAADCSLRVSFCPDNTPEQVDALLSALDEGLHSLIRIK